MATIKKFNWVNRPSRWQNAQAWASVRKNMVQRFLDEGSNASTAFLNAQNNLSTGMATLAAQASITRAQNQIREVQRQFAGAANSVNRLA
jgi:hypothetical protein